MKKRILGSSTLSVSTLCFGGNVFGWTLDEKSSFNILDAYVEAGGNFIDTADIYSSWVPGNHGGESETIIGKWLNLRKNRDKIVLATKVGMEMGPQKKGLSKAYILWEVEDSLKRLQTDYIDLYISHRPDPNTPAEETLDAYDLLIKQGKVRYCGASNFSAEDLKNALEASQKKTLPAYQALQPNYNLYLREEFETNLRPFCEQQRLAVTPYYSLASGYLTGKYRSEADLSKSPRGSGMRRFMNERGTRILKALDQVALDYSCSLATVAVAWLINQPTVTSAIASATSLSQLKELVAATKLDMSPSVINVLNKASNQ